MEGRPQSGESNPGVDADLAGPGDEGKRAQRVAPPLGDEGKPGQTQTDAPAGDVGVPPDEEMDRPG